LKKKYSINWEDDTPVSVEVNGTVYASVDLIPDPGDRKRVEAMIENTSDIEDEAEFDRTFDEINRQLDAEALKHPNTDRSLTNLVFGIFMGVAVLLLGIAGFSAYLVQKTEASETVVIGQVVEVVSGSTADGRSFYSPVVKFRTADGAWVTVTLQESSRPSLYAAGDSVKVRFDPARPQFAMTSDAAANRWILAIICGVLGGVFLGVSLLIRRFLGNETS